MHRSRTAHLVGASTALLLATGTSALHAQEAPPITEVETTASEAAPGEVEEIFVTAQKRQERIQDVPLSITAVGGDMVESLGMGRPTDVLSQVPNVKSQAPTGGSGYPIFNIRGVTLLDFSDSNEPSISVYSDDIYLGSPAVQNQQLFDVQRVEVLRGPQGTLYGRNATGGLVHFISRKPTSTFEGSLSGEYGSYNDAKFEGIASGPLSDSVRGRLAARYETRDGWQHNLGAGGKLGGIDKSAAVRGLLDFDLSDNLVLSTNLHYSKFEGDEDARGFFGKRNPAAPGDAAQACSTAQTLNSQCVNTAGFSDPDPDPEHVYSDERELPVSVENTGGSVRLAWDLGSMNFTSITGYEEAEKYDTVDADAASTSAARQTLEYYTDHKQFSQELRLSGTAERLTWIAGAYYYEDDRFVTTLLTRISNGRGTFADQTVRTGAAFGQLSWALTETVNLTGGLRYTDEERDLKELTQITADGVTGTKDGTRGFTFADKISLDKVTGRIALDWKIQPDTLLYSSISTGFKSGAFNTLLTSSPAAAGPVKPEELTAYELGLKTAFWDRRASLNAAAFYYDYKDIQAVGSIATTDGNPATTLFINVGDGTIYGLELELTAQPVDRLTVSLGAGLLKTEIKSDAIYNGVPLDGNRLVMAPKVSFNGIVRYDHPLANAGTLYAQTDFQWQDDVYFGPDNLPTEAQDAYGLINLNLGWTSASNNWETVAFVKNLSDKEYFAHGVDLGDFTGFTWGRPRTFGLRIKRTF